MADENSDKITAFDTLFTTNHIRMCKILLPHLAPHIQRVFAIYIKLSELMYTMSFFKMHPDMGCGLCPQNDESSAGDDSDSNLSKTTGILQEILPYSSPAEQTRIKETINMIEQFKNMQDMLEMVQMMKELFPESGDGMSGGMSDIMSALNPSGEGGFSFDPEMMSQIFSMMNSTQK